MKQNKKKKILISCMAFHIGDFIWATSAIAILKKTYPDIHITILASKSLKELIVNNPVIDEAIFSGYPKDGDSLIFSIKNLFTNLLHIPRILLSNYDSCIILNHSHLTVLLSKLCLIKKLVGADLRVGTNNIDPLSKYYTHSIYVPRGEIHASVRFQTIIKSYFGIYNNDIPVLPDASKYDRFTKEFIKSNNKKLHISICPQGAGKIGNRWASSSFANVIKSLSDKFPINFYILGSGNSVKIAEEIISLSKTNNVYNLCTKTSILECLNFVDNCNLFITVDTGLAHLAAITKTPIIGLYGSTPLQCSMPMSSLGKVFYFGKEPCYKCELDRDHSWCSKRPTQICMDLIKPEMVIEAALEILNKSEKK
jgi:heptosyltransferase-2